MTTSEATARTAAPDRWVEREAFVDALRMEWTKYTTLRAYLVTAAGVGVALPAFALVVALTGSLQPDDTVLGASVLAGASLAMVIAVALGTVLVTGESRSGMLRLTFAVCPQRGAVLAAKAMVAACTVFAIGLIGAAVAFALGVALLPDGVYTQGEPFPALLGVAALLALTAVIGVAIGALVRESAPAVGLGVAVVLLPAMVGPMLGDAARWVGGASLVGVMQKLSQSSDATAERVGTLGAWPSLALVAVCAFGALAVAAWVLRRRDA